MAAYRIHEHPSATRVVTTDVAALVAQTGAAAILRSMTDDIRTDTSNGVLTLTLNRPQTKNALTRAMYRAVADIEPVDRADEALISAGKGTPCTRGRLRRPGL